MKCILFKIDVKWRALKLKSKLCWSLLVVVGQSTFNSFKNKKLCSNGTTLSRLPSPKTTLTPSKSVQHRSISLLNKKMLTLKMGSSCKLSKPKHVVSCVFVARVLGAERQGKFQKSAVPKR